MPVTLEPLTTRAQRLVPASLSSARAAWHTAAAPRLQAAGDTARRIGRQASPESWAMASAAAGVLSTAVLMLLGRRETGSAFAPLNATSHIVWGDRAATVDRADWKHTAVGQVLHHASAFFWGALFETLQARRARRTARNMLADAALTTAVAAVVDYKVVPERLTPGYEKRLSNRALVLTYGVLAAGLVIGGLAASKRRG